MFLTIITWLIIITVILFVSHRIIWCPLRAFDKNQHKQALLKFTWLLILSSFPIIIATLLSPKSLTDSDGIGGFLSKLFSFFSHTEQFVYSAAFLPPIIYLIVERYYNAEINDGFSDRIKLTLNKVFKGYWIIFITAILVLLVTAITYTASKINEVEPQNTYLYELAENSSLYIYFFALYCWYLSILDGFNKENDFVQESRNQEQKLTDQLSKRLSKRGAI